jgi:hypothetical protein
MKIKVPILVVLIFLVVFGAFCISNAEVISSYIIDDDTVYIDDENVYIDQTPHTIYGDGWVTSNIITKNYSGSLNVAYGFNTTQIYPTSAELYDPHLVQYTTNHRAWFYNVSSTINTSTATPIDYGNDYNTHRYTITSQKCISYDEMSMVCNEWIDETAVVAFDSHETDGTNYTAFWHTDRTRIENYKDISYLFQSVNYTYDGKNKWYYVTNIPFTAGEMRSVRTYIKVNGAGDKYDVAVWPSHLTIQQAIATGCFYLLDPWAEVSELNFTSPTPVNESTVNVNHTTINVSIATSDLTYFAFNWNGTNVTYTTVGTEWDQSADSYVRSTTVGTYTQPDFDTIFPWSHMRRCTLWDNGTVNYYLNATNSSLKATGGLSDLTGADGQVMVEIPKFHYTHTLTGSEHNWEISKFNISGFSIHNTFIKNGVEVDYRYIGAYEGSMWDATTSAMVPSANIITNMYASGDKLCSVSGEYPKVNEVRSEFRAMAAERGAGWRQQDFDLISAVQLLYLIEYADFNSQSTIGSGRTQLSGGTWTADSYIGQCGKSNTDGDGTNSVAGNTNNAYMTYRGIENFYGDVWNWVDGININNNIPYVSNNDSDWADDTSTNYTNLGVTLSNTNGYQTTLADTNRGFLPSSVGGSSSTYISDYYYQNPGWRVVLLGGDGGARAGAFCMSASSAASGSAVYFGGRLAY